jgi:hypothetical protein
MQHLVIKYDPVKQEPYVDPYRAKIWRDDQSVMWSFSTLFTNMWWDPEHADNAIQFAPANEVFDDWPGPVPTPVGQKPGMRDRRKYMADARKPNIGNTPIKYYYVAMVEWEVTNADGTRQPRRGRVRSRRGDLELELQSEAVDPEILNEPQP